MAADDPEPPPPAATPLADEELCDYDEEAAPEAPEEPETQEASKEPEEEEVPELDTVIKKFKNKELKDPNILNVTLLDKKVDLSGIINK